MKKILILTKEFDPTTCDVIDWLAYKEVDFFRVNGNKRSQKHNFI